MAVEIFRGPDHMAMRTGEIIGKESARLGKLPAGTDSFKRLGSLE
jgi:hypothetical protein